MVHRDRVTQGELLFGGAQNAIFVGHYDPTVRDVIWTGPEWTGTFTAQKKTGLRVLGMAECNGKLYASVNGYVLEREDGPSPSWRVVAEVQLKTAVSEGLRGLTAIANPSGNGEVLMAAAEDSPAIVYMIDPSVPSGDGYAVTVDQNISALITPYVSAPPVTYAVVAYNHMTVLPDATDSACPSLLLGMEVRTPNDPSDFGLPTHAVNPHAYFVVRDCHGNYGVRMVRDNNIPEQMLVSVRTLLMSPFADDPPGTVYAGGFDANKTPVHDSGLAVSRHALLADA